MTDDAFRNVNNKSLRYWPAHQLQNLHQKTTTRSPLMNWNHESIPVIFFKRLTDPLFIITSDEWCALHETLEQMLGCYIIPGGRMWEGHFLPK